MKLYNEIRKEYVNTNNGPVLEVTACLVFEILESKHDLIKTKEQFKINELKQHHDHLEDMDMKLINETRRWILHD